VFLIMRRFTMGFPTSNADIEAVWIIAITTLFKTPHVLYVCLKVIKSDSLKNK
jgi:hypothetical protein